MASAKHEMVSFKVDHELMRLLQRVENRSAFIRAAVLAALDSACPLCGGSGILQPHQRQIWDAFSHSHPQAECGRCHEQVFTCDGRPVQHDCRSRR